MNWTFLIVDPAADDVEAASRLLKRIMPDAEILRATAGEAAVTLLEETRLVPSLVFVEHNLGGMSGAQLMVALRERLWLESTPVVMLSSPVDDRVVVTCYRLGAVAFLTKPTRIFELRETVRDFARPTHHLAAARIVGGTAGSVRRTA